LKHRILIATTNPGKAAELKAMLDPRGRWACLEDFPGIGGIAEDGDTFAENARKKALGYAAATGLWTIADDSGLVVDALGGDPGVRSSRFSGERKPGEPATRHDRRNMAKVLELLEGVGAEKRTARFVCRLCLASPGKVIAETAGTLEGVISDSPAGTGGFGYDPIVYVPHLGRTVAQLTAGEKNAVSHRGSAARKLAGLLKELDGAGRGPARGENTM
jgi:XTP/dITP diphosphohydrolase